MAELPEPTSGSGDPPERGEATVSAAGAAGTPPDPAFAASAHVARKRGCLRSRWFRALAVVVAAVALWGLVLRFVAPGLLRDAIVGQLAELTGRPAEVERIEIEPYALVFRLHGLSLGEQSDGSAGTPARSHARLSLLEADFSWRSLRRLAPVLERLRLVEPVLSLARDAQGIYDGADIVERLTAQKPDAAQKDAGPPRFSIANIELSGGSLGLDDRKLGVRHSLAGIGLRVPFVSSLPVDQQIEVEPGFEATFDDAPLRASGRMLPFANEPAGQMQFALDSFDLTRLLPHLPQPLPVKLESAKLASELVFEFRAPDSAPAALTVRGRASLEAIELRQPDERPLLKLPAFEAGGIVFDLLESRLSIEKLTISQPEVAIERRRGEARFFEPMLAMLDRRAAAPPASEAATKAEAPESAAGQERAGFSWSIGAIVLDQGRVSFDDADFSPQALQVGIEALDLQLDGLAQPQRDPAQLAFSGRTAQGELLNGKAQLRIDPLAVDGEASIEAVPLASWAWLAGPALTLKLREGKLAASARYRVGAETGSDRSSGREPAQESGWMLSDGRLRIDSLALHDAAGETVGVGSIELQAVSVDPEAHRVVVGSASLEGGRLALRREADGRFDATGWWRPEGSAGATAGTGSARASGSSNGSDPATASDWQASIGKLALRDTEVALAYAPVAGKAHPPLRVTGIAIEASDLATDGTSPVPLSLDARIGKTGRFSAQGTVVPRTGALAVSVNAHSLPVPDAQPWLPPGIRANLVSGALSAEGRLQLEFGEDGAPLGDWKGTVGLTDLDVRLQGEAAAAIPAAMIREGRDPAELIGWKSLRLSSTRLTLEPFFADLGDIEIDGLRARLAIQPNGRFNLQDLIAGAERDEARQPAASGPPSPDGASPPLRIGGIRASNGNIDFSDYFIRPNYSANLTGLAGSVGEMRAGKPAELTLDGRIDNTGSVKIAGRIDPIGEPLFLELRADAHDIDLPALSPYSGKYVGYGIEKGKLSASVEYRVQEGQLSAENKIVLDQLTFGEPVDSPDALKLPVQFAVSLLKDRNGVIDVQLPIGGSLDDPQFSVAGIVMRIIGNLIVKAVTAPFSLIAGLVGGSGEELSSLAFAPAEAGLDDKARERLASLAKALAERPGLKLDIGGRATAADRQAMQKAQLEARLARIRKAMNGTDEKKPIGEAERAGLLAQAWRMGRSPVPPEKDRPAAAGMERELVEAVALPAGALDELANRRAQAAKDWLAGEGGIDPARLFVTAPKSAAPGAEAAGQPEKEPLAGVEMSLK